MKLIDLLVQELPKLGGWPEGAEYARVSYFGVGKILVDFRFPDAYGELSYCIGVIARNLIDTGTDVDYHMIRRDSYESALSASQKPAWNGEGLPPVGCECEWQDKNIKQWQPVKVVYASEWVTVVREINKERGDDLVEVAIENYGDDSRLKFRPLRTEAERKRDAAIEEMIKIATIHTTKSLSLDLALNSVYNAIAAGKIPGVKLDD
ncbi:hypothetical protein Pu29_orf00068 [Salmonella phage Pu29]|uniref:Uncharacterized protein n=1 Tax=Salmonella phage SeSz-2 TaxID=2419753 RepID=A0A411BGS6_9CAUD|nr:hypothetical protein KGB43_gp34 [Salmonella phage SeSz-2]QAY00893.1 hypothetical protein SeSz2_34 [Salmonella phage SeSz-2]QXV72064.1 hypothetical protein [Salmonella phage D10]WDE69770.1 hypothetical protein Pu29_orf00068 [Salmonella phage Pu29]HDV5197545.1 hypothetical protein [Salmonella enterica subsp. enterica serovar Typhimurium]